MEKILGVVVTYNRLDDLKICLRSLKSQTCHGFDIVVVNNGSTDGTRDYLDSQSDIITIHQDNLGGAGGFYAGMKYMFENGYDWLWMMDDDGIPDENQLKELLKYGEVGNPVLNAIVVNKDDHSRLAFNRMRPVNEYKDILTESVFCPFNGTFIHRSVIEKIGFIKKEMFIWGDESEYVKRIKTNGYTPKTLTSAIHYHPREKGKKLSVFPFTNRPYILFKPTNLSRIYYRNLGYIDMMYREHWYTSYCTILKHIISFSWRFRLTEILKFVKYYRRGWHCNFELE